DQPGAGPGGARGRPGGTGAAARLLLAGERARAAERAEAGAPADPRPGPLAGLPPRTPGDGRRARRAGDAPWGTARPGGVHPPAAWPRLPRPVQGDPAGAGPAPAPPRPGVHRREPGPGRPPAGDRPAN